MRDVALATKVFSRAEKLGALLKSAGDAELDAVYVADDGEASDRKDELYAAEYPFDLTVLDLEYDAGLGRGRNAIVEVSDEPYLLFVDSDHRVPGNIDTLVAQAEARPDLGGISGLLYEDEKIRGTCHDLHERGDLLVRDVREDKPVEMVAGAPLVEFEFLPNVVLLRRECLSEQAWDDEYVIGKEHLDFYVAHAERTDWRFAVSPTVLFDHRPGGDEGYVSNRESAAKLAHSKRYFLKKWGYRQILLGQTDWTDATHRQGTIGQLVEWGLKRALLSLPSAVQAWVMNRRDAVRRRRSRPPL